MSGPIRLLGFREARRQLQRPSDSDKGGTRDQGLVGPWRIPAFGVSENFGVMAS